MLPKTPRNGVANLPRPRAYGDWLLSASRRGVRDGPPSPLAAIFFAH
jgi:hypothetical protein